MSKEILQDPWQLESGDTVSAYVDYHYTNSDYIENPIYAHLYLTIEWNVPPPPQGDNPRDGWANFKVFITKPDGSFYELFYSGMKGVGSGSEYQSINVSSYFNQNGVYTLATRIEVASSYAYVDGEFVAYHSIGKFSTTTQIIVNTRSYKTLYDVLNLVEGKIKKAYKNMKETILSVESLFYSRAKILLESLTLNENSIKRGIKYIIDTINTIEDYITGEILIIVETINLVESKVINWWKVFIKTFVETIKLKQINSVFKKITSKYIQHITIIFDENWDKIKKSTTKWIRRVRKWL